MHHLGLLLMRWKRDWKGGMLQYFNGGHLVLLQSMLFRNPSICGCQKIARWVDEEIFLEGLEVRAR